MSAGKNYLVLLVLAGPIVGWAVWHVTAGSRDQLLAAAPPAEAGMPDAKAQATNQKAAAAAAAEAKLVARAAVQAQPAPPPGLADKDAQEAAKAAAGRAGELLDLQSFLAGRAEFVGPRKDVWARWHKKQRDAREVGDRIVRAKDGLPAVADPAAAARELAGVLDELKTYRAIELADLGKAANWELAVRAKLAVAQYAWADGRYDRALRPATAAAAAAAAPEWDDLKAALPKIRDGVDEAVRVERNLFPDAPPAADTTLLLDDARRLRAEPWDNREKLFTLPLDTPWNVEPGQLNNLFEDVYKVYSKLKPPDPGRALIRRKVQAFCGAYIPPKLGLGPDVVWGDDGLKPRGDVTVTHAGGKERLSADPGGVNEHTFRFKLTGVSVLSIPGSQLLPGNLKATAASTAAYGYFKAREVVGGTGWQPDAVGRLIVACEEFDKEAKKDVNRPANRAMLDALHEYPGRPDAAAPVRVMTRLSRLAEAMDRQPKELFDPPAR